MQGLKEKTAKNILWVSLLRIVSYGISLITSFVLARVLFPDEYGIVSMAMVFIGFGEILGDFGLSAAIIQKQKENIEKELYTGATLRLIFATGLYLTVFSIAPFVADFMAEPRVTNVIRIASLQFFLTSAGFVVTVRLTRELKFNKIVLANLSGGLSKGILVIALAFIGFSYWSVVFGNLAGGLITVVVLYSFVSWKVKFVFDVKVAKELLNFGKYVLAVGIMTWVAYSIDKFVVGKLYGTEILGAYQVAWTWGILIPSTISGVLGTVLFPTYAKIATNKIKLKNAFLLCVEYISLFSFLIGSAMICLGPEFVKILLAGGSSKWDDAIPVLICIALFGIYMGLFPAIGSIFGAVGRPKLAFVQTIVPFAIVILFIYPLSYIWGAVGTAITYSFVSGPVTLLWGLICLKKVVNISFTEFIKTITTPLVASVVSIACMMFLKPFIPSSLEMFILKAVLFITIYIIIIFLIMSKKERNDMMTTLKLGFSIK